MVKDIVINKLPGNKKEAKVVRINKNIGDIVNKDDTIFEIEGDKANMEIVSDRSGKIVNILIEEGDIVNIGDVIGKIDELVKEDITKGEDTLDKIKNGQVKLEDQTNTRAKKQINKELICDITIVGGGPGGYVAAIKAAKMGQKVILVEKDKLGGTCLNRGCIPTKALVRSAEIYENIKSAEKYGLFAENISFDMEKIVSRKNNVVSKLVQGIYYLMEKNNVEVVEGVGEIKDKERVCVRKEKEDIIIKSKSIIIATGSVTAKVPIPGADTKNVIYSDEALELTELPEKIVIVGGGVIGMEFAFLYNTFGAKVTVIEFLDSILSTLDEDVCTEITNIAKEKGIKIYTGSQVKKIIEGEGDECIVVFEKNGEKKYISVNKVLLSIGRKPNYEGVGVDKLGIELNEGGKGIKVNNKLQTNLSNIYAIGDVTNKLQLAHVASHQGIIAVQNIVGNDYEMDYTCIPSAIFTNPEIAVVGVNEKIAKEQGIDIEIGKFPFAANGKVLTTGEDKGFIKLIKDKAEGKVIGGVIIGLHAADLIAELALAVKNGLTTDQIIETIHAHPTISEAVHEASLAAEGGALHFAE